MSHYALPDAGLLDAAGLNLHAVFAVADLPAEIRAALPAAHAWRQLILIGHAGQQLWRAVQAAGIASQDPIDDFTLHTVGQWCAQSLEGCRYQIAYPGSLHIGLQALGKLAGWHHASPFMVGINARWGSWFAYRAVVLADSDLPPSTPMPGLSPCLACREKVCVAACPGRALENGEFSLKNCLAYRKQSLSLCRTSCVARVSCPVATEHRYCAEQIQHSYGISMAMIERYA